MGKAQEGVENVRAAVSAARGALAPQDSLPPARHPARPSITPARGIEREHHPGQVWWGGRKSRRKMAHVHLLLLANACISSQAVLPRSFSHAYFSDARDLLSGFDSSLCISDTLKVSNCVLKNLWPIADLSKSRGQPFLLADADAGNS